MLRIGVAGPAHLADAAAGGLRERGIDAVREPGRPVALTVAVAGSGGRAGAGPAARAACTLVGADVVLTAPDAGEAAAAAGQLHRSRLEPWVQALSSDHPDVTAPPQLLRHEPAWAAVAARRGEALRQALAGLDPDDRLGLRRIDHIGSTAVPGLAAKSFLDLQIILDRLPDADTLAAAVAPLGWAPAVGARPDSPGVHRDARMGGDTQPDAVFAKRLLVAPDPVHPGILHIRLAASPFGRRVVRLRDALRADPQLRQDYEQVKHRSAEAHAGDADYDDYTRDKSDWLADAYGRIDARAGGDADPWPLDR